MLTADQIDALGEAARKIAAPITEYLLQDITQRIAQAGRLTSTAQYQIWRAQQLGLSQRELKKELRRRLRLSHREIRRILYRSAQSGYELDIRRFPYVQAIPFAQNVALQQIVSAAVELAQEDFTNLTQTLGMADPFGNVLPLRKAYRSCTDFAFQQVITGAASYTEAVRQTTKNLAEKGVRTIDYESGVHTSLEAAVRRNIMGGLGLMQEQIGRVTHDQLGCDGWELSAHANSAPDHEPIQGKQYSDQEYEALNGSLRRRIGTLNCGHTAFPVILGVSEPQYSPAELERFREDNQKGVTVEGRHYTGYETTQMQRKLERAIRARKRRVIVDEAAGDEEKLSQDKTRLTLLHQRYREFSKAAGLKTQYERTEVVGFGERQSVKPLEKQVKSGILKDVNYEDTMITEGSIQRVPLIRPDGWSEERAKALQEAHRELLRRAQREPLGVEVSAIYATDMTQLHTGVGEEGKVSVPGCNVPHIIIHNHPSNEIFSHADLISFLMRDTAEAASVVGNGGNVYFITKLDNFDGFRFLTQLNLISESYKTASNAGEYEKCVRIIENLLEGAKEYGLEFIRC